MLGIGVAVGGLQEGPPLVLRFLVNELLDVLVKRLDGRISKSLVRP